MPIFFCLQTLVKYLQILLDLHDFVSIFDESLLILSDKLLLVDALTFEFPLQLPSQSPQPLQLPLQLACKHSHCFEFGLLLLPLRP